MELVPVFITAHSGTFSAANGICRSKRYLPRQLPRQNNIRDIFSGGNRRTRTTESAIILSRLPRQLPRQASTFPIVLVPGLRTILTRARLRPQKAQPLAHLHTHYNYYNFRLASGTTVHSEVLLHPPFTISQHARLKPARARVRKWARGWGGGGVTQTPNETTRKVKACLGNCRGKFSGVGRDEYWH